MGAPKQKWTMEEEMALKAGVDKYGPGKWRAIQKDPKFGPCLTLRSNVDLKDKWRNMSVAAGAGAIVLREKPGRESRAAASAARDSFRDTDDDGSGSGGKRSAAQTALYDDMITTALFELKDPGGSSSLAIAKHAEEHNVVPASFKRILASRLKKLVESGKLVKVKQNYLLAEDVPSFSGSRPGKRSRTEVDESKYAMVLYSPVRAAARPLGGSIRAHKEMIVSKRMRMDTDLARKKSAEEAARLAALAVAEAEAAAAAADQAAREAEAAEAEAEAAEAAAEAAAAAVRPPKKRGSSGSTKAKS